MAEARASGKHPLLPFPQPSAERRGPRSEEHERLAERLVDLEREARAARTSSHLVHDVANRLGSVLGAAERALASGDPEELRAACAEILAAGRCIQVSLEEFESFRLRRPGPAQTVPAGAVVDAVRRLVEPAARSQGVTFFAACATASRVTADPALLEQALVATVLEALRAAADGGGRVVLSAFDTACGLVRFSVRDTGSETGPVPSADAPSEAPDGLWVVAEIAERLEARFHRESGSAGTRVDLDLAPTL